MSPTHSVRPRARAAACAHRPLVTVATGGCAHAALVRSPPSCCTAPRRDVATVCAIAGVASRESQRRREGGDDDGEWRPKAPSPQSMLRGDAVFGWAPVVAALQAGRREAFHTLFIQARTTPAHPCTHAPGLTGEALGPHDPHGHRTRKLHRHLHRDATAARRRRSWRALRSSAQQCSSLMCVAPTRRALGRSRAAERVTLTAINPRRRSGTR